MKKYKEIKGALKGRRRLKLKQVKRLLNEGKIPRSKYHDGTEDFGPAIIKGKKVEIYPSMPEGYREATPHYQKYIDPNYEAPRAPRRGNPSVFPSNTKDRICSQCGESEQDKRFHATLEVCKDFMGWCVECTQKKVDSVVHPVERPGHKKKYVGPPGRKPARAGCQFCGDGSDNKVCQFCVTELMDYGKVRITEIYRLVYPNKVKREIAELYGSKLDELTIERVKNEQKELNKPYFEWDNGMLIRYEQTKKEKKDETRTRPKDVCKRRGLSGSLRSEQEAARRHTKKQISTLRGSIKDR